MRPKCPCVVPFPIAALSAARQFPSSQAPIPNYPALPCISPAVGHPQPCLLAFPIAALSHSDLPLHLHLPCIGHPRPCMAALPMEAVRQGQQFPSISNASISHCSTEPRPAVPLAFPTTGPCWLCGLMTWNPHLGACNHTALPVSQLHGAGNCHFFRCHPTSPPAAVGCRLQPDAPLSFEGAYIPCFGAAGGGRALAF